MHAVPTRMTVDEIFSHADKVRIGVVKRVVRVHWLVELDKRRGKTASSLLFYLSGVLLVRGRALRFGGRWCPVDHYEFARRSLPVACTYRGLL